MTYAVPTIVLLDDDPVFRRVFIELHSPFVAARGGRLVPCASDADATAFIASHGDAVRGVIQDFRRPGSAGTLVEAGVAFFNDVIMSLTPPPKTLILTAYVQPRPVPQFSRPPDGDHLRMRGKGERPAVVRSDLEWLLAPACSAAIGHGPTLALVQALAVPWKEICAYLARHPEHLHTMDPRRFEELVAEMFLAHGWTVDLTARTRDGGYDIIAVRHHLPSSLRVLVEAKRWHPDRPIGVGVVRALHDVRVMNGASQVVLATTSHVSRDARREFSRVIPWELDFLERDAILAWCGHHGAVYLSAGSVV